ncbi:MAG: gamma-glutamylcyclotransferase [Candidatus Roizmanbacteria bacterium]|nr:gamma-glutamylcyclotransferase [Candidatus Roizmanbacteria bacterium]
MKRLVFTFGTLYEPKIITALLGTEPPFFLATVQGYTVYKGGSNLLPPEIYDDISSKHDMSTLSFLFAQKSTDPHAKIHGKVYEITTNQETVLDWWERYPRWYRKENITVTDKHGKEYEAFMYAIDKTGEVLETFERVQGNVETYITSAKELRKKLSKEFPNLLNTL